MPDAALVEAIRRVLIDSPFHGRGPHAILITWGGGEGYRKVPPRPAGPVPSGNRIDRLLTIRLCGLLVPFPPGIGSIVS